MSTIPGRLIESASIAGSQLKTNAEVTRSQIAQTPLAEFPITVDKWRVWDAIATNLPATPATDDLGLVTGTWGTDAWTIETGDLKAAGAITRYAACVVALPDHYEDGQTITLRVRAGMETTVADTSATIDFSAYVPVGDGTLSADLVSTAAQSINSLTEADFDFTITPTSRVSGELLQIRMAIAVNDAATGTAVTGVVYDCSLLCDVRP